MSKLNYCAGEGFLPIRSKLMNMPEEYEVPLADELKHTKEQYKVIKLAKKTGRRKLSPQE